MWSTCRIYELVGAQRDAKPCSVETPTACCCNFFLFTATRDRIAVISLTFQPTAIQRVCLRVLVFQHTMYVSTNSNPTHFPAGPCGQTHYVRYTQVHFWHQRFFVLHLMNCPNVMSYVLEISLCTHAQASESTTRHGPFHDYEHHRYLCLNRGESPMISRCRDL